jgi:hypothetical protein
MPVFWALSGVIKALGGRVPNQFPGMRTRALNPTKRSRATKMRIAIGIRVFIFSLRGSLGVFAPVPALTLILQCKLSVNCVHLLEICVLFSAGWLCVSFQAGYGAHLSAAA